VGRAGRALRGGERDNRRARWNDVQSLSRTREQTNRVGSLACIALVARLSVALAPLYLCCWTPRAYHLLPSAPTRRFSSHHAQAGLHEPDASCVPCPDPITNSTHLCLGRRQRLTAAPYFFYHTSSAPIHDAFDVQRVAMALCASRSESRAVGKPLTSLLRAQAHPGAWTLCSLFHTSIQ
jgi:hypothetical protein